MFFLFSSAYKKCIKGSVVVVTLIAASRTHELGLFQVLGALVVALLVWRLV